MLIETTPSEMPLALRLRRAFSSFPTGVVAVCALPDGEDAPVGMAMNSFTSISLDPALVAISVANTSRTWPKLAEATSVGVSVLGHGQEHASRSLSAREGDRFENVDWVADESGAVHLEGAALWLTCHFHRLVEAGDHTIALLGIDGLQHFDEVEPLVFHQSRYRSIVA
ncbi:flavin reductase family protein [Microbacterium esteraromaticum]|uniref:flavin reductase family protein n=1 Tax=Microbacterium esteraromaticum TaxID=57043 RepID=UPI0037C57C19